MTNAEIAAAFEKIGDLLSLKGENPFRIRAYQRAAQTIAAMSDDVAAIYRKDGLDGLDDIPGIGADLAAKIEEMVTSGDLAYLRELTRDVPAGLLQITGIQGMGPKKTKFVWEKFKVESVEDLEKLATSGKLTGQPGWGEKSVKNVLEGIAALRTHGKRVALPTALTLGNQLLDELKESGLCKRLSIAGSLRRRKETIGDIDILATSDEPAKLMELFCGLPLVERVLGKGPTKSSVQLSAGLNADLRVVDEEVFGAALHYFTGSKEHNIRIRTIGIAKGLTISEYGVYEGTAAKKGKLLASRTEEDVYRAVGLAYVEPELREDRGEIEAAAKGALPVLIEEADMKADLHFHSNFSDGSATLIDMATAAKKAGLTHVALCDHASVMGMVHGIKEANIDEYLAMVEDARRAVKGIEILAGAEVDILEDGSLYLPDAILQKLDWVVASVHGGFTMSSADMTARIVKALNNPYVCVFAHPTSRLLLRRDPVTYDIDDVFRTAARNSVALEINASISRLDLNDVLARRAKEAGCLISINSDAHHPREFNYRFGITQARRAWLEKEDVINTWTVGRLREWMGKRKVKREK